MPPPPFNFRAFARRAALLAALCCFGAGCALTKMRPRAPSPLPLKPEKMVRIMALGDQITIGSATSGNYRRPLQAVLARGGYAYQFVGGAPPSPAYIGKDPTQKFAPFQPALAGYPGLRIDQIASDDPTPSASGASYPGLAAALARGKPDIVLLLLGANDVLQDYSPGTKPGDPLFNANAVLRLNSLIDDIYYKYPRAAVVVATIPQLRDPALNRRAQEYDKLIPTVVATRQRHQDRIALADISAALTPADISADGILPTSAGYDKMAQVWYAALTGKS